MKFNAAAILSGLVLGLVAISAFSITSPVNPRTVVAMPVEAKAPVDSAYTKSGLLKVAEVAPAAPGTVTEAPTVPQGAVESVAPVESSSEDYAVRDRKTLHVTTMENCPHCRAFENEAARELEEQGWIIEYQPVSSNAPQFSYGDETKVGGYMGKANLYAWLRRVTGQETVQSPETRVIVSDTVYSSCGGSFARGQDSYRYSDCSSSSYAQPAVQYRYYQQPVQRRGFFGRVFGGSVQSSGYCVGGTCY